MSKEKASRTNSQVMVVQMTITKREMLRCYEQFFTFMDHELPNLVVQFFREFATTFSILANDSTPLIWTEEKIAKMLPIFDNHDQARDYMTMSRLGTNSYDMLSQFMSIFPTDKELWKFQRILLAGFMELEQKIYPSLSFIDAIRPGFKDQKGFEYQIWKKLEYNFYRCYGRTRKNIPKIRACQIDQYFEFVHLSSNLTKSKLEIRDFRENQKKRSFALHRKMFKLAYTCFLLYEFVKDHGEIIYTLVKTAADNIDNRQLQAT